jgi:protease-4
MRVKISSQQPQQGANWLKYGGILLLGIAFLVFLGILLFSSISTPLFGKCVAVVELNQEITTESVPASLFVEGMPGSEEIAAAIKELDSRDDVGAVVFVVNSPGGSVVATREIYDAVKGLEKPKVAYFREVAASGAYYVSSAADYIISEPNALTGSIGVIMTLSDMSGLFEKIGLNMSAITSGEAKDIGSFARPMTEKERQILQALVDEIFSEFKSIVLENRGSRLNMEKFDEILDGRVVSGRQAKKIGLVDELGNKQAAISKAAQLANITDKEPAICEIELSSQSQGLFNARSLLSIFEKNARKVSVKYE